ncbi:MAG: MFS transporter [Candidatus Berkelbacteria bacterium]
MAKKTVRYYLLLSLLYRFSNTCFAATYVTFLMSRGGLNLFQVNMVNFIFFATMFLTEIPTGAVADCFGRKLSFLISCSINCVSLLVYALSHTFTGFATAEAMGAVGSTFSSGAFQAWVVDSLNHHGYQEDFGKLFARQNQLGNLVGMGAAIIGAHLATINPAFPWFLSAAFVFATGVVAIFVMREDYREKSSINLLATAKEFGRKFVVSAQTIRAGGPVTLMMLLGLVYSIGVQAPNMQWQPYFRKHFASEAELGYLWAGVSLAIIIGSQMSAMMRRGPAFERLALIGTQVSIGLFIALAGIQSPWMLSVLFYLIHEAGRGMFSPLKDAYLNDAIQKEERATLLSCGSISSHIGSMVGLVMSGLMANRLSIAPTWIVSGIFLVVGTLAVSRIKRT